MKTSQLIEATLKHPERLENLLDQNFPEVEAGWRGPMFGIEDAVRTFCLRAFESKVYDALSAYEGLTFASNPGWVDADRGDRERKLIIELQEVLEHESDDQVERDEHDEIALLQRVRQSVTRPRTLPWDTQVTQWEREVKPRLRSMDANILAHVLLYIGTIDPEGTVDWCLEQEGSL